MDDNTVGMEIDPELAAAMGFSSFGPAKKSGKPVRAEAVTETGTGTNRVQLGPRKRQANSDQGADSADVVPRKRRADHDDAGSVGSKATNKSKHVETVTAPSDMLSATPPQGQGEPSHSEERIAVQSSSSAEKPKKNKETVPTGLAAFLARGKELPEKSSTGPSNVVPDMAGAEVPTTSLPETSDTKPASTFVEPDLQALRNGIRDGNGDIAYFLPSFIEDPWTRLERQES